MERAVLAPPRPDRAFEIGGVSDHPGEPVLLDRVMGRTDLEHHLMIGAEVNGLHVPAFAQVPEMQPVSIFVRQQVSGHNAVLELGRQAPFARNHVVARQVPPEVVLLVLQTAVQFVTADHLERFAVHDEDAGRAVCAVGSSAPKRRNIDACRAAMDGVRPRIAGLGEDFLRLDDLVNLRLGRIGLGVDDVDARGTDPRNDQVTALQKSMAGKGGERR
jgi:hypothetical protein